MCNPNALYYQQMVTQPNAYWLHFFLKRDINVICWNYRGYGESEKSFFEWLSPFKSKRDAEYVLAFLVNKLRLRSKIGVYGRSIGGITACHLNKMYPDLIQTMIIDRSFSEIYNVPQDKLQGGCSKTLYDCISCKWRAQNPANFLENPDCFKIITCDPFDDTVMQFSNLATGVGAQLASTDYTTSEFKEFYQTLMHVFNYETQLYNQLGSSDAKDRHTENLLDSLQKVAASIKYKKEKEQRNSELLSDLTEDGENSKKRLDS